MEFYYSILPILLITLGESLNQTEITIWPKNSLVDHGEEAVINCSSRNVLGLPVEILWLKNGEVIDFQKRTRFINVYNKSLVIQKADDEDSGTYTCFAKTSTDSASGSAKLYVRGVPVQPELIDVKCIASNLSAILRWRPRNSNNSPILGYIVHSYVESKHYNSLKDKNSVQVSGYQTELMIPLTPWSGTKFQVQAKNTVGLSEPSYFSEECSMPATVPFHNPANVYGRGNRPDNLVIYWKPLAALEHNGPELFYRIYYRLLASNSNWINHVDIHHWDESNYVINNQKTFQSYGIRVEAHNMLGRAKIAAQEVIGFSGEDVPMAAPKNLTIHGIINQTSAELRWTPVDLFTLRGHFLGYKIHIWTKITNTRTKITVDPSRTSYFLTGLMPSVFNYVCIKVFNSMYDGPCSNTVAIYTYDPGPNITNHVDIPPISLNISEKIYLNIKTVGVGVHELTWNISQLELNHTLIGYRITWKPEVNEDKFVERTCDLMIKQPNATGVILKILEPKQTYLIGFSLLTFNSNDDLSYYTQYTPSEKAYQHFLTAQFSTAPMYWFIGIIWSIAFLLIIVLIAFIRKMCCGEKYKVKKIRNKLMDGDDNWADNIQERSYLHDTTTETQNETKLLEILPQNQESQIDMEESQALTTFGHKSKEEATPLEIDLISEKNSNDSEEDLPRNDNYHLGNEQEFQSLGNIFQAVINIEGPNSNEETVL